MKEIFFKGIAIALPCLVIGGLFYLVFHGFYSLYADRQLKKELDQIARESAERRRQQPPQEKRRAPTAEDFFE